MAMVDSPLPGPAGCCWGDGGGGALLLQRRLRRRRQQQQQQQQQIQLEEEQEAEREEEGLNSAVDHIDRLPDSVLLLVFNRIGDVKALGRCCAVSRRFHALVPEVDDLLVRVDCVIPDDDAASSSSDASSSGPRRGLFSHLARLVLGGIVRPLQAIGQILAIFPIGGGAAGKVDASLSSSSAVCDYRRRHPSPPAPAASSPSDAASPSHHSPTEVLRNFKEMRRLRIELPTGEVGVDDGVLLKWRANFGSTLNNCVILGASSVVPSSSSSSAAATPSPITEKSEAAATNSSTDGAGGQLAEEGSCRSDGAASSSGDNTEHQYSILPSDDHSNPSEDDGGAMPQSSFYAHGGLKQRVMWTISSLIAAAARHHMLQPIVADHGSLESLDVVDAEGQGVLRMDRGQMEELRGKPVVPTAPGSPQRTLMPSLDIKLWHARQLELSDGMVLQGATLVAIRPIENPATAGKQLDMSWVSGAFEEELYGSAVRQLIKGRMHCLEMNSF